MNSVWFEVFLDQHASMTYYLIQQTSTPSNHFLVVLQLPPIQFLISVSNKQQQ